jgi:predicted RNA polymerase sigma factor
MLGNNGGLIQNGHTALMRAALCGRSKIVRVLLRLGANIDIQDEVGRHQLCEAVTRWPYMAISTRIVSIC